MKHNSFACFILTHGRPKGQRTLKSLRKFGYTGEIYLIVDNEDATAEEYKQNYDNVIVFDKEEAAKITDRGDIDPKKNTVLFARNMCHRIAKDLGLEYFCELDDDYHEISFRYIQGTELKQKHIANLDLVFDAYLDLLDATKAKCVCMAQMGDFIGGATCFGWALNKTVIRKAMNCYFMRTDRPYKFIGRMNDDVNTYVTLNKRGELLFTYGRCAINQEETQQQSGGLTDMYKENGTYMKSMYSVMVAPSCVKVGSMGSLHRRVHHRVSWKLCAPKILREELKK